MYYHRGFPQTMPMNTVPCERNVRDPDSEQGTGEVSQSRRGVIPEGGLYHLMEKKGGILWTRERNAKF